MSYVIYINNGVEIGYYSNRNDVEKFFFSLPDAASIIKLVLRG